MNRKRTRSTLPDDQQVLVAEMYRQGATFVKLAKHFHCSVYAVSHALREQGVTVRASQSARYLPTGEEIEQRARAIRESWDEETADKRNVGGRVPYSVPVVPADLGRGGDRCRSI